MRKFSKLTRFKVLSFPRKMSFTTSLQKLDKIIDNLEKDIKEAEKLQTVQETPKEKKEKPKLKEVPKTEENEVSLFGKANIQVSKVLKAEKHPNADTLVKCEVEVAPNTTKPLVAGILKSYEPSTLVGKHIITILNLKPATIKGETSEAMLFASTDKVTGQQKLLEPPSGSTVGDRVYLEGNSPSTPLDRVPPKQWEKIVQSFEVQNGHPTYAKMKLITKNGDLTVGTSDGSEFH